jgi:hypothetical protein
MARNHARPPWEFLLSASRNTLQNYELSRLALAANLRKEAGPILDQWVEELASAMMARWLLEEKRREVTPPAPGEPQSENAASASDNFFPDSVGPPRGPRSTT